VAFGQVSQPDVAAGPVEHGGDGGAVERPEDEISFKVTDLAAARGDRWTGRDGLEHSERAGLDRWFTAPRSAPPAAPAPPVQTLVQSPAQASAAVSVDGLVDALV